MLWTLAKIFVEELEGTFEKVIRGCLNFFSTTKWMI